MTALVAILTMGAIACAQERKEQDVLRIATFNNQIGFPDEKNEPAKWSNRAPLVRQLLLAEDWDIVGMQEPMWHQCKDMESWLPDYAWVGRSVYGPLEDGPYHYNPIFYKKDLFELLEWDSFWFSDTPDEEGSMSWGNTTPRMCTWAHFRDRRSGRDFYHFNMHYDHRAQQAMVNSSRLMLVKLKEIAGDKPAFFTGDYNSYDSSEAYRILAESEELVDTYTVAKVAEGLNIASWNEYKPLRRTEKMDNLDHFFVTRGTEVLSWRLVTTTYDGKYPSDHFPIVVEWKF